MEEIYRELARTIQEKTEKHISGATIGLQPELGVITSSMGLKLDRYKHEIQDYKIADWTAKIHFPEFFLVCTETSPVDQEGNPLPGASTTPYIRHDFAPHSKEIDFRIEFKAALRPGDRVLVIQVNSGQDFVILSKVVER